MSMVSQGYPLWAVDSDGTPYAVVGWIDATPILAALDPAGTEGAGRPRDGQVFTFTTTDPTARTFSAELVSEPDDLRQRLAALADTFELLGVSQHPQAIARLIREELAK